MSNSDKLIEASVAYLSESQKVLHEALNDDHRRIADIGRANDPYDVIQMAYTLIGIASRHSGTSSSDKERLQKISKSIDRVVDSWGE